MVWLLILAIADTVGVLVLFGAILFGAAGGADVPAFWGYLAASCVLYLLALVAVFVRSPDLIRERMKPGAGERDRASIGALMALLVLHYVLAGLDAGRYHWLGHLPVGAQVAGFIAYAAGFLFVLWAMLVNPYFSSAVRLQEDRGQEVVTSGPYRFVRHPGYTGGLVFILSSGVALGSWVSVLPMLLGIPVIVRRAVIEDRMLLQGLRGYAEYAAKVRYRLLPGVW